MPLQIYQLGALFEEVQMNNILGDGKTFPDCIPKRALEEIKDDYHWNKAVADFDLKQFVLENFSLPPADSSNFKSDSTRSAAEHIEQLWDVLTRNPDEENSSIIPLKHPYVV